MRFSIAARADHLLAEISGRETAHDMREFLVAVQAACREHGRPKILMRVTRSRPVFKPEDYGLSGYVNDLVTPKCQVALLGDTAELNAAHEYIEVVARQQNVNVRAFSDEASALRWLEGAPADERRYRFARLVLLGAPDDAGVYSLWDGEELIYYGRAAGGPDGTIRTRLLDHFHGRVDEPTRRATHYSWELCADPVGREADLLREFRTAFGRPPRCNGA
jgi:hypothetical protein